MLCLLMLCVLMDCVSVCTHTHSHRQVLSRVYMMPVKSRAAY